MTRPGKRQAWWLLALALFLTACVTVPDSLKVSGSYTVQAGVSERK